MSQYACAITAIVCGLLPVPMFLIWRFWPRPASPKAAAAPTLPARPAALWLPCHNVTVCAHLSRPHDRTPTGLRCRACGTVTPAARGGAGGEVR